MAADEDEGISLHWGLRVSSAVLALVLVCTCVVLIWRGRDGSAVVALVVVGGTFALLALAGSLPSRLVVFGNETQWKKRYSAERAARVRAVEVAELAVEEVPAARLPEVLRGVRQLETNSGHKDSAYLEEGIPHVSSVGRYASGVFEAISTLSKVASRLGLIVDDDPNPLEDYTGIDKTVRLYRPDASVRLGHRTVQIEVKSRVTEKDFKRYVSIARNIGTQILILSLEDAPWDPAEWISDRGQPLLGVVSIDEDEIADALSEFFDIDPRNYR